MVRGRGAMSPLSSIDGHPVRRPCDADPPLKLSDRLRKNVSIKLESGVGVLAGPDVKCDPEKWQRGTQIISGRVAARCQTAGNLLRHSTITPIQLPLTAWMTHSGYRSD